MSSFLTDPIFGHPGIRGCMDDAALAAAMLRVEIALAKVQAELGIVPEGAARAIRDGLSSIAPDPADLRDGVRSDGVPVPSLLKALRKALDPEDADWLHYGATSQDIVDSALCLCFGTALDGLQAALGGLIDHLDAQSRTHAQTLMLARTRGQLATPITFGLRLAQWAQPLIALEAELGPLRPAALRIQLGGASGSRSVFGDRGAEIARGLAAELGLADAAPWHTDRSGMRRLANWLARLIAALAKIGRDVALSSRGEIKELHASNTGGSSTMPHKSNPVTAEALQSLGAISVACEAGLNASAAHAEERDGALWPVEWALMPKLFEAAGSALDHADALLRALAVDADAMRARIGAAPEVRAEAAVFALAPVLGRAEASQRVAEAMKRGDSLSALCLEAGGIDPEVPLGDSAFTQPAAATARAIFAARRG